MKRTLPWLAGLMMLFGMPSHATSLNLPDMGKQPIGPVSAQRDIQVSPPHHPVSLLELTDIALQNNPSTRSAWAQVRAAAAQLGIAKSAYWPQLQATFSASHSQSTSTAGFSTPAQTRYGPSISLSYLLWDFGARSGKRDQAKLQLVATRLTRNQTLQDVILEIEQDYYQIEGLTALLKANRKSLHSAQTNLTAAKARKTHGLATLDDVYQSRSAVEQARLTVQKTHGNLAAARGTLATDAGYPVNTRIKLIPWKRSPQNKSRQPGIQALLTAAHHARPELLAAKAQEMAAKANIHAVTGQWLPSITLNANAGKSFISPRGNNTNYRVGATVDIPIFAGFSHYYQRKQAQAQAAQARANTNSTLRTVELEVWQAYQNLQTAHETLSSSKALLSSARQAEKVARARYKHGLDTILQLLTAQKTLASARAQQVTAQLDYHSSLAALGHAVGGLNAPQTGNSH